MDILLSKYGLIFTEFDSIDRGGAEVNTFKFSKYQTIIVSLYNKTVMDILLSKYGLIFTEFESIDLGSASVNTVKFSKYQTIFTE